MLRTVSLFYLEDGGSVFFVTAQIITALETSNIVAREVGNGCL
jgi:hypothetical protein